MSELSLDDIDSRSIGNLPLIAGIIDYLGLDDLVELAIKKVGSHVKVSNGKLFKALVMQQLNVPYQSLLNTAEYYEHRKASTFLDTPDLKPEDLNRYALSRLLDAIHEYGSQRLFLELSAHVIDKLGIKVTQVHIDSTSLHYDGETRIEEGCAVIMLKGHSRDNHPELNQIIIVQICDTLSKIPLAMKNVSGNINDNKSFFDQIENCLPWLKKQYSELKYFTGDSALCTPDILDSLAKQGIFAITRVPDKYNFIKDIYAEAANLKDEDFVDIYPLEDEVHKGVKGKWVGTGKVGNTELKLLLVKNTNREAQKTDTINTRAAKEKKSLEQQIKKLSTQPRKCRGDAEGEMNKIIKKLKLCKVTDIRYEEVMVRAKAGRPKKGEDPNASMKLQAVKVFANVEIDETLVKEKIQEEQMFVIGTSDLKRKWTMVDLLSDYKRQSVVERNWKVTKDPRFMIDALYLQKPSRIEALTWLMMCALLVYTALEYILRKSMQEANLSIPSPDKKKRQDQPTLRRFLQYIDNQQISVISANGQSKVIRISEDLDKIFKMMGAIGRYYYLDAY